MRALVLEGEIRTVSDRPLPEPRAGEALIRMRVAGICNTDLELVQGYMGFQGVLGHEFVGTVEACDQASWVGKRVVGEINCGCGRCAECESNDSRHCAQRTVLGIVGRDGAFAEYLTLPVANLHEVPEHLSDEAAVFTEPLAAAFETLEQVHVRPSDRVLVLGDGKLGLLVAQVLALVRCDLLVVGKHSNKLEILGKMGISTMRLETWKLRPSRYDVVVEATGTAIGFAMAVEACRPRGTLVLKTTTAAAVPVQLAPIVIHELTVVGSRCGPFAPALRAMADGLVATEPLLHGDFELRDGLRALEHASLKGVLKTILRP